MFSSLIVHFLSCFDCVCFVSIICYFKMVVVICVVSLVTTQAMLDVRVAVRGSTLILIFWLSEITILQYLLVLSAKKQFQQAKVTQKNLLFFIILCAK